MDRYVLTDAQWAKMEPHCLGKPTDPGRSGSNNRLFIEAVLPDQYLPSARQQLTVADGSPETHKENVAPDKDLVTEIWKNATMSILIDSRTHSVQHDFAVVYVGTEMAELAAAHGFGHAGDVLYYSTHRHFR